MSVIIDSSQPVVIAEAEPTPGRPPSRRGIWIRVALAVAVVAASGGLRLWQQGRFDDLARSGQVSPFPLEEIPLEIGPWTGIDDTLDPKIAAATGAVDAIFRTYTNRFTGARVSLILLYGPSIEVTKHAPETCYPASGYTTLHGPDVRQVGLEEGRKVPFFAHTFTRGEEGHLESQRVFCTWQYQDTWSPSRLNHKQYQRIPGAYKVHLARMAVPGERFNDRDPCEDLASLLLPIMQRRLEAARGATRS